MFMTMLKSLFLSYSARYSAFCFLVSFSLLSCGKAAPSSSDLHHIAKTRHCFDPKAVQKILNHFKNADPLQRIKLLARIDQAAFIKNATTEDAPIRQIQTYFRDVLYTQSNTRPDHLRSWKDSMAEKIILTKIPAAEPSPPIKNREVLWDGLPVPGKLQRFQRAIYRGESKLVPLQDPRHDHLAGLREIFSRGLSIDQKGFIKPESLHGDLYKHTMTSIHSNLLSASKEFDVARNFGINPQNGWSAVLEFQGMGVDLNQLDSYFKDLPALKTAAALVPEENEFTLTQHVPGFHIKGLWVITNTQKVTFIKNPNWKESLSNQ